MLLTTRHITRGDDLYPAHIARAASWRTTQGFAELESPRNRMEQGAAGGDAVPQSELRAESAPSKSASRKSVLVSVRGTRRQMQPMLPAGRRPLRTVLL